MLRKAATSSFGIVKPSAACFAHTVSVTGSVAKPTVQVPAKTSSSPMDRDASSAVKSIIDSNRVVVFGKSYCPHTRDAKKAIEATGLHDGESGVKFVDMDREADGAAMQEALAFTGSTTVPRVFINGRFCGGEAKKWEAGGPGLAPTARCFTCAAAFALCHVRLLACLLARLLACLTRRTHTAVVGTVTSSSCRWRRHG